ncbi:MAG: hypothetical protein ABSG04_01545 [Verrucomicrobiota bacterium]
MAQIGRKESRLDGVSPYREGLSYGLGLGLRLRLRLGLRLRAEADSRW